MPEAPTKLRCFLCYNLNTVDFKLVLEKLLAAFKEHNVSYALMGGFALGLYGVGRSTVDIDFLVHRDDIDKVDRIMQELGYKCKHRSENVSQYVSPLKVFGEVDFLHAFRDASLEMLRRTEEKEVFGGSLLVQTLKLEDLIFVEFFRWDYFRADMERVAGQRHNPFLKEGRPDADAYIEFVVQYNEFINHGPKPFRKIVDTVMKL